MSTPIWDAVLLDVLDWTPDLPCDCTGPPWHCPNRATHRAQLIDHPGPAKLLCDQHSAAATRLNGTRCAGCGRTVDVNVERIA